MQTFYSTFDQIAFTVTPEVRALVRFYWDDEEREEYLRPVNETAEAREAVSIVCRAIGETLDKAMAAYEREADKGAWRMECVKCGEVRCECANGKTVSCSDCGMPVMVDNLCDGKCPNCAGAEGFEVEQTKGEQRAQAAHNAEHGMVVSGASVKVLAHAMVVTGERKIRKIQN